MEVEDKEITSKGKCLPATTHHISEEDLKVLMNKVFKNIQDFDPLQEIQIRDTFENIKKDLFDDYVADVMESVNQELKGFNPMDDPDHGFSEKEVEILFHRILLELVSLPFPAKAQKEGLLGLTHSESIKFNKKTDDMNSAGKRPGKPGICSSWNALAWSSGIP